MFKPVNPKVSFPELEEAILKYWKEKKIFEKSIEQRPVDKTWTFLDGPPFITGMPHYGTLLSSLPKDLFPRFWTMKGYRVYRKWGWDCHGLPAENKVETKLGLKSKREIEEKVGVKKFIEECKLYVSEVSSEWEWYIDHIARWVDFKNAYKTMDLSYMETVMWVFKQMYTSGHIYKGLRVSLYCPHCATPISNFEVAMDADNYKEIQDVMTTYKYQLKDGKDTYILAWSTTPWNKIVTPALAVNPKLTYAKVKQRNEKYILAKATLKILNEPYEILEEFPGKDLIGKKFIPHYDYYPIEPGEKAFVVVGGDFVAADEGTGVVTIAAYGEEDLTVMQRENIHIEMHLDEEGMIKPDVPKFGGMYYLKVNKAVDEDLSSRGLVYKTEFLPHNVPLCWRCHTRLYYAPQNAWYVNIQDLKDRLKKTNEKVNWFPKHFKYGRFLKSLENAPDWNISRSRYWGSPVPVWECECGERFVPGSIQELEEASGQKITDLHKPDIDEVKVTCRQCGKKAHRVPEVLDSWIEAGSASFAERHFPFNPSTSSGQVKLEDFFPPDFIAEYTGQIRAWFYVLHVIGGALYDSPAFKNVVVEGVILGTDGRKMSKNYGNYPDPKELLQKYGGDALRLYLMGSPVMHGEDIIISEEQYRNQVRGILLVLWNVYNFFVLNANASQWDVNKRIEIRKENLNLFDQWILSRLNGNIIGITKSLNEYDTPKAIGHAEIFLVHDLSNWYLRRSRDRFSLISSDYKDKNAAFSVLWHILVEYSKTLAPIVPFITEQMFTNLTSEESVHLQDWPLIPNSLVNESDIGKLEDFIVTVVDGELEKIMDDEGVRQVVERSLAVRKSLGIRVRQPLNKLTIFNFKYSDNPRLKELLYLVKEEVNVKHVEFAKGVDGQNPEFDANITSELKAEGQARDIVRSIQEERKKLGTKIDEKVHVVLPDWPKEFEEYIKRNALVNNLSKGEQLEVKRIA